MTRRVPAHRSVVRAVAALALAGLATFGSTELMAAASPGTSVSSHSVPLRGASVSGADWPGYLFNTGHGSYNAGATAITPSNVGQLSPTWQWVPPKSPNSATTNLVASPTVVNGVIYQGVKDGYIFAINQANGSVIWSRFLAINTPLPPGSPSCGVGDYQGVISTSTVTTDPSTGKLTVYVFAPDGFLYALDAATGNLVWKGLVYTPSTTVNDYYSWGSPLVANGKVYIGVSSDCDNPLVPGGLQSFDQSTGAPVARWTSVPAGQVGGSVWSSPALADDGSILVTTGNGYVSSGQPLYNESIVRLDPSDLGRPRLVADPRSQRSPTADFGASPTTFTATLDGVSTPMVGACNKNGFYYAFRQSSLSAGPVWQAQIATVPYRAQYGGSATRPPPGTVPISSRPVAPSNTSEHRHSPGSIQSLNPATGTIIWQTHLDGTIVGSPTEDGGGVVTAPTYQSSTSQLGVYLVSAATGAIIGFISTPKSPLFGQAVFAGNQLLVGGAPTFGLQSFQVPNPAPGVTGVNPSTLGAGRSTPIAVTGTNFQSGLTVSSTVPGASFSPPTAVTSTSLDTVATVPSAAQAGTYDLVVTNPDGQRGLCPGCLTVTGEPPPPPPPPGTSPGSPLAPPVTGMASTPTGDGYWLTDAAGAVSAHGAAQNYGSMAGQPLNAPIDHIVATPDGRGYWLVASDGGTFTFGDAGFYGSMGGQRLNAPVVDIAPTRDGKGYWLVATDGGVFSFGDAAFQGSTGGLHLNKPVVGISADYATGGYWLVATDGGVFSFGAPFFGSTGNLVLNRPVNGMAATSDGQGYWMVASDGGVFSFGDAAFHGSMGGTPLNAPVVGMATDPGTGGYWMVASDGGVFSFGAPFYGAG